MPTTKTTKCMWCIAFIILTYTICRDTSWEIPNEKIVLTLQKHERPVVKTSSLIKKNLSDESKLQWNNSRLPVKGDLWLAEQKRRASQIKEECKGWRRNPQLFLPAHAKNLTYLLVDDRHKAIYCYIAKVACTNWKRLWMILTGLTKVRNPMLIPEDVPHRIHDAMMLIKQPNRASVLNEKLRTYTKLLIVRHPYERLLSAYRDKFEGKGRTHYKKNYAYYIMKTYRTNTSSKEIPISGNGLTFSEFITYITNLPRGGFDEHWKPYADSCYPCAIQYDVIAKYETLTEDSERFLRLIKAPNYLHFPVYRSSNTSQILNSYMNQISLQQRKSLYSVYKRDFSMFQYDE